MIAISAATGSIDEHGDTPLLLTFTFAYDGFATEYPTPSRTNSASTPAKEPVSSFTIIGSITPGSDRNVNDMSPALDSSQQHSAPGSSDLYSQLTASVTQATTPQTAATALSSLASSSKRTPKGGGARNPGLILAPDEEDPTTPAGAGSLSAINATTSISTAKNRASPISTPLSDTDSLAQTTATIRTPAVTAVTSIEAPSPFASSFPGAPGPVEGIHPLVEGSSSESSSSSSMLASNAPAVFTQIVGTPSIVGSDSSTALASSFQTVATQYQSTSSTQATAAVETQVTAKNGLSPRATAGIAVGVIIVFSIAATVAYLLLKKRRNTQNMYMHPKDPLSTAEEYQTMKGRPILPEHRRPTSWAQRAWAVLPGYRDAWDPSNYRRKGVAS